MREDVGRMRCGIKVSRRVKQIPRRVGHARRRTASRQLSQVCLEMNTGSWRLGAPSSLQRRYLCPAPRRWRRRREEGKLRHRKRGSLLPPPPGPSLLCPWSHGPMGSALPQSLAREVTEWSNMADAKPKVRVEERLKIKIGNVYRRQRAPRRNYAS